MSPLEIRLVIQHLELVATYPTIRLALRLILLALVRKSELKGCSCNRSLSMTCAAPARRC